MQDKVILVDRFDRPTGEAAKLEAHRRGLLHRAFSVFIVNSENELLLQQRSRNKYHSGGLWSNSCCSHPRPGEETSAAARRRLKEEMGIDCELSPAFAFTYRAEFENGLTEYEYDHVYCGRYDGEVEPSPHEVMAWRWLSWDDLAREVRHVPLMFTVWFRLCYQRAFRHMESPTQG